MAAPTIDSPFALAVEEALLRARVIGLDNLVVAGTVDGEFFWTQALADGSSAAVFFDELAREASVGARLYRSAGGDN